MRSQSPFLKSVSILLIGSILISTGCQPNLSHIHKETVQIISLFEETVDKQGMKHTPKGSGSGSFIDNKGTVLTAKHVVSGASKVFVITSTGKQYAARLITYHPTADL